MDEYTQLRTLLLSDDEQRLDAIEHRLNNTQQRSDEIAQILPDALRSPKYQSEISTALHTPTTKCMQNAFKETPAKYAKALMPAIEPALKTTIANALRSIRQFSQTTSQQLQVLETDVQKHESRLNHVDSLQKTVLALQQSNRQLSEQVNIIDSSVSDYVAKNDATSQQLNTQLAKRFKRLEIRLDDAERRSMEVAQILPNAIRQANNEKNSEQLVDSLQHPVEFCIKQSVEKDTQVFADALFPIMGPAIRRSINESLKNLIQSLNQRVESTLSPRNVKWWLEAKVKRQSFAEIVLERTLQYRVEQVFLIHKHTGLLMQHVMQEDTSIGDGDAISAMLTAIQDFIQDSFSSTRTEELNSVEIGEYHVWLERGPHAVLACVIRGAAPYSFREIMRVLQESLHAQYGRLLENFEGDTSPPAFNDIEQLLQKALASQVKPEVEARKNKLLSPINVLILLIVLGGLGSLAYHYYQFEKQKEAYLAELTATAGIHIMTVEEESKKIIIHGLRDPLALNPDDLAKEYQLDVTGFWVNHQDDSPQFIDQRIKITLSPPEAVTFNWDKNTLFVQGSAPASWVDKAEHILPLLAGSHTVDLTQLKRDEPLSQALKDFLNSLRDTPGIVVASYWVKDKQLFITGLRDELAEDPNQIMQQKGLSNISMQWRAYEDLSPEFVKKRIAYQLAPPKTVETYFNKGKLQLSGYASSSWLSKMQQRVHSIAGVKAVDTNQLISTDMHLLNYAKQSLKPSQAVTLSVKQRKLSLSGHIITPEYQRLLKESKKLTGFANIDTTALHNADIAAYKQLVTKINTQELLFTQWTTFSVSAEDPKRQNIVNNIKQLIAISKRLKQPELIVYITGHTDGVDKRERNLQLSQARAQVTLDWLKQQGINVRYLNIAKKEDILFGEKEANFNQRKVSFHVKNSTKK